METTKRKGRSVSEEKVRAKCEELGLIYVRQFVEKEKTRVVFICQRHSDKGEITSAWTHLRTAKHGCPYCIGKYKTTSDFISEVSNINPGVEIIGEYKTAHSKIRVRCKKCNHEWSPEARSLLYGEGCPICSLLAKSEARRHTRSDFIDKLHKAWPNIYLIGDYIGTHAKVHVGCSIHGNDWYSYPCNLLNKSAGCPMCASERFNNQPSAGERSIATWLDAHNIMYMTEHKLDGCEYKRPLRFDFFLPAFNMAIEYDGEQHYMPVHWYANDLQAFADVQARDAIKNKYCESRGISLLRISYNQHNNIADILSKNLNEGINYTDPQRLSHLAG